MQITIHQYVRHRNGIHGAPFDVIFFEDSGEERSRKVAVLFDEPNHCAILDLAKLAAGDITFGSNLWREDRYEEPLRAALTSLRNREA